ncbi:hypothetical protein [Pleurochrysis sp. endemic virus 1a]|nr:hypothetical protein [Pleurochrysis sp. endemic virus 1a]AUL80783.1 hypothetical protein [Pleurochrysis sp. endemic virus 1b]
MTSAENIGAIVLIAGCIYYLWSNKPAYSPYNPTVLLTNTPSTQDEVDPTRWRHSDPMQSNGTVVLNNGNRPPIVHEPYEYALA